MPVATGGGGWIVTQTQPAGILGLRTKTRSTVVIPIGQPQQPVVCPPQDDDDDEIQIELLRQIISELRERDDDDDENQLMMLVIELLRQRP